jgi:hypothetical protein
MGKHPLANIQYCGQRHIGKTQSLPVAKPGGGQLGDHIAEGQPDHRPHRQVPGQQVVVDKHLGQQRARHIGGGGEKQQ